jgi:multiple antibiotic resistance protein
MSDFAEIAVLLLVILNPFALAVYLIDLFRSLRLGEVFAVLARAVAIGGVVFSIFAWSGQKVFTDVLQIRFAAFQVFGGIVFLVMALRFMLTGSQTLVALRGSPGHVAGAIAMPFLIGPGTVSAATLAGMKLPLGSALAAIALALTIVVLVLCALKILFDWVSSRNASLVERYVEVASRVNAMVVGSIAVEMTFDGLEAWVASFPP